MIFSDAKEEVITDVDNIAENTENATTPKLIQRTANIREKTFDGT